MAVSGRGSFSQIIKRIFLAVFEISEENDACAYKPESTVLTLVYGKKYGTQSLNNVHVHNNIYILCTCTCYMYMEMYHIRLCLHVCKHKVHVQYTCRTWFKQTCHVGQTGSGGSCDMT